MANNPIIYDAVIAGTTGGVNQRWLSNPNPAAYISIRDKILVVATTIDALYAADPTLTIQDGALMQSICQQVFASRWPQVVTPGRIQTLVLAIKAQFDTLRAVLEPVPGGGSIAPLSNVMYVDLAFAGTADGSIAAPFTTIQEAVDALPAGGGTIQVCPGVYPAEAVTITGKPVTLNGLTLGNNAALVDLTAVEITSNNGLCLMNISAIGFMDVALNLVLFQSVGVDGANCTSNIFLSESGLLSGAHEITVPSGSGTSSFIDSFISSVAGVLENAQFFNTQIVGTFVCTGGVDVRNCDLSSLTLLFATLAIRIDVSSYQSAPDPSFVNTSSGQDVTITGKTDPDSQLKNYESYDDFDFLNNVAGGAISTGGAVFVTGQGAWFAQAVVAAGTMVVGFAAADYENHPGILGIRTATNVNAIAYIGKQAGLSAAGANFTASQIGKRTMVVRPTTVTDVRFQFGFTSTASTAAGAHSVYFQYDSSISPNWFAVCRDNSVETAVDTGIPAAAATWFRLRIKRISASEVQYWIGDTLAATVTTNIPGATRVMAVIYWVQNLVVGTARGFDIDYHGHMSDRLNRM